MLGHSNYNNRIISIVSLFFGTPCILYNYTRVNYFEILNLVSASGFHTEIPFIHSTFHCLARCCVSKIYSSKLPRSVCIQIKNDILKLLVYLPPKTQHFIG